MPQGFPRASGLETAGWGKAGGQHLLTGPGQEHTPPRVPQANVICERVIGTLRRECLDFMIPLTENHLADCCGNGCSITITERSMTPVVFPMKVTLLGSRPPIGRRLQVASETPLAQLHRIVQHAMGWESLSLPIKIQL